MFKFLLLIFFLVSFQLLSYGAVHLVSNQSGVEKDFSSIQSAIEYAAPYDTIFVKGSPMNYGNVLLEKPLILLGEGFSGDVYSGHTAKLTRILFTANPYRRTISSGSQIIGFEFPYFPGQRPNIITVSNESLKIENITIERNWLWFVEIVGSAENWVIRNNIIRGWINGGSDKTSENGGASNFTIQNNILNSVIGFKRGNNVLENNILLGRLKDIKGAFVLNNIFARSDEYIIEDVFGTRFHNNLTTGNLIGREECYENENTFHAKPKTEGDANAALGNKIAVNPGFVYWPSDDIMGGAVFKLADSSIGRRAGVNGAEVGIFGGKYPFPADAFLNPEIDDPFPSFITSIY